LRWCFVVILAVFPFCVALPAKTEDEPRAQIVLSSAQERVATPKSLLSCVFVLTNLAPKKDTFNLQVHLPGGWETISNLNPLELSPQESGVIPLTVSIPQSALAGSGYQICLASFPATTPDLKIEACSTVTILPQPRLKITAPPPATVVFPGGSISYSFTIANLGNARDKIEISALSAHREKIDLSPQALELGIGEQGIVTATIHLPLGVSAGTKHVLTLRATSQALERSVFAEASVYTPISEKRIARDEGFYRSLPSRAVFHLSGLGSADTPSPQAEFYTGGKLTDKYWMNFAYQGPYYKQRENYRGVSKEIYSFDYGNDLWTIALGDTSVNLSELTEQSLYERGEKFMLKKNPFSAMVFSLEKKQSGFTESMHGGKFSAKLGKVSEVGINYFASDEDKTDPSASRSPEKKRMSSVLLENRLKGLSLTGEYAESCFDDTSGKNLDQAWRVNSAFKKERFFLSGEYVDAGPAYPGLRKDYQGYRSYLAWRLLKPLWLWRYQAEYHNNLNADPARTRDNNEIVEYGSSFSAKNLPYFSLSYKIHDTKSELNSALSGDNHKQVYTWRSSKNFGALTVSFDAKFSQEKDNVTLVDSRTYDYTGRIYRYGKKIDSWLGQSYNLSLDDYTSAKTTLLRREAGFTYQLSAKLDSSLSFSQEKTIGEKANDILTLSTHYSPWEDYTLAIEGEMRQDRNIIPQRREWKFWLTLKAWFDLLLPVKLRGALEVSVFLDENDNGRRDPAEEGVGEIGLFLDVKRGVSNRNGKYRFVSLAPGEYLLNLDISSLAVGLAARIKLPQSVSITRGKILKVDIPLVKVGRISGLVYEDSNKNAQRDAEEKGVALIRVILSRQAFFSPRDTFTDALGNYSFAGVLPGECEVKLDADWLPSRYIVTTPVVYPLQMKPAEQLSGIEFGISEKEKQIIKTYAAPEIKVIRPKRKGTPLFVLFFFGLAAYLLYLLYHKLSKEKNEGQSPNPAA
jgi:hypothetical protein